jgi:hypothetical protein
VVVAALEVGAAVTSISDLVRQRPDGGVNIDIDHPRGSIRWELPGSRADELRQALGPCPVAGCTGHPMDAAHVQIVHEQPPVERYVLATVEMPGGAVFAGLAYSDQDDIVELREELRSAIDHLAGGATVPLTVSAARRLSLAFEACASGVWTGRPHWLEVWNEREALTQTYAPWGKPRIR